ncbi:nitroreductase [Salinarchaeum sp. Harcht-Bsk1]|uniref:nitroreductase family protein n=1 Tax=Salinarchaeum sp. Harcht-Bsk1 TaxID=1333523 RepID=UPI00034237FE|nr:nitroreductase family protein [Salinarchaeum sp. Harcht-Bsk1]AGN02957.1 nitroreductase [Salinarchaeum sp. Harcht-Bsk1]
MDVTDVIQTAISVREFTDEPVDTETKRAILDAGHLSQSGHNSQHWRPILVDDADDLARLAELSTSGSWVADADFAVVIVTNPERHYHEIDAGRTITHMQFAAWDRGIGSCIYTGFHEAGTRECLDVPEDLEVTAVIGFGHPTFDVESLRGRKDREPLDEIVSHGRYGNPLALSD